MKTLLTTCCLLCALVITASAQTIVQSMQTINNDNTLAMTIVGKKDGRPFRHSLRFDVAGMAKVQRDSLYQQTLGVLDILGIRNVPGMKRPGADVVQGDSVVFRCETCGKKGKLEISGGNYLATRPINPKRDPGKRFPLTMHLSPGDYKLLYRQRGSREIQSSFSVKAGEQNVVTVK
ncbi:MAG: hypothetical protein LH606_01965 [Cytophagaceae bacterium]|nr:hypothetical protein [Cytophagaceae bacterium]